MTEVGDELDLALESLCAEREPDVVAQNFDGDVAIVFQIAREVHGCHGTVTKLSLDLVSISDGCAQPFERCRHYSSGESRGETTPGAYYMDVYCQPLDKTNGAFEGLKCSHVVARPRHSDANKRY